jgi:Glycosyl hydrolase family 71
MYRVSHGMRRHVLVALAIVFVVFSVMYAASGFFQPPRHEAPPPQYNIGPTTATPYLPFDMPNGATNRKVFAHYVPWYPISLDNQPADSDYYTTGYIAPTGEGGAHAAYGGLLRDRPLPRAPLSGANWRDIDVATEISQAKSVGIDGFAVDVVLPSYQNADIVRLLTQAQAAGNFSIQITADMSGFLSGFSPADFASNFASYLKSPAAQRLDDGRVVLGAFFAEKVPVEWWTNTLNLFRAVHGINVAFVPTFLDANANMNAFAPISYGLSNWGARDPMVVDPANAAEGTPVELVRRAHSLGKIWMQPVAFQDNRPKDGTYSEVQNAVTNRNAWQIATIEGAEWANLITWNDYAETTAVAPSAKHGWRMLDVDAYWIALFKYGMPPPVLREALYVSHRTQPFAATPTYPETLLMHNTWATPSRDTVEVESFARSPGTVIGYVGGNWYFCAAPPGFGVCTFPLTVGQVAVGLYRDNAYQVLVVSPYAVTNTPYVQDLQYTVAGGLR